MGSTGTQLIQNFKSSVSVAVILEMLRPFRILIMIQQPMMQLIDLLPCTMGSLMGYVASKKCVKTNVRSGYPDIIEQLQCTLNIDAPFSRLISQKRTNGRRCHALQIILDDCTFGLQKMTFLKSKLYR